jgi:hypothetical protein
MTSIAPAEGKLPAEGGQVRRTPLVALSLEPSRMFTGIVHQAVPLGTSLVTCARLLGTILVAWAALFTVGCISALLEKP